MHFTHKKGKSVVAERFVRTLKGKIYSQMTANDTRSYIGYLKKLVDEYILDSDYFYLSEKIGTILKYF